MTIKMQICWLIILAMPIACVAWTITHEEVFREPREYFTKRCETGKTLFERKFFYLFTCEYCFSHYITVLALIFTGYKLLLDDWRGYVIAGFALVWVANIYMSLFGLIRLGIKKDRTVIKKIEDEL
jgi:hypothetical protein